MQIRKQAAQSKLRELHPKGSLRLLCAGVAENANQPTFPVDKLIEQSADMAGVLNFLKQASCDAGLPLDERLLSECEQMFIAINHLLYEQQSQIKHKQMMQVVTERATRSVQKFCEKSTVFNQAI